VPIREQLIAAVGDEHGQEAANRLHFQKGLIAVLLGGA